MDKVIQIANICKDMCNIPNPIPGRIYYAKGCAPALNTCGGGVEKTDVFMDKAKVTTPPHHRLRYALGRTNPSDHYASSSYHVLPWFNCVVSQTSGTRFQMIIEI